MNNFEKKLTVGELVNVLLKLPQELEIESNDLTGSICLYQGDVFLGSVDVDTGEAILLGQHLVQQPNRQNQKS